MGGYYLRGRVAKSWDGWLAASSSISQQGNAVEDSNACDDHPMIRKLGQEG